MPSNRLRFVTDQILPAASLVSMVAALFMVFIYVPTDSYQGVVQRIFYFHVPAAFVTFTAIGVVALGSVMFLWRGSAGWDRLAHSAAEVGLIFCSIVLTTGPIWARPIWGTWWTWDARLTMTVILWTIYAVYLVLRAMGEDDPQIARYAAVLAIVGVLDVPLIMVSVRLWRGMHPSVISAPAGQGGIQDARMIVALVVTLVAFTSLFLW